jgi:hypothetical protein
LIQSCFSRAEFCFGFPVICSCVQGEAWLGAPFLLSGLARVAWASWWCRVLGAHRGPALGAAAEAHASAGSDGGRSADCRARGGARLGSGSLRSWRSRARPVELAGRCACGPCAQEGLTGRPACTCCKQAGANSQPTRGPRAVCPRTLVAAHHSNTEKAQ